MTSSSSPSTPGEPHTLIADYDHDDVSVWSGYCTGCDWYSGCYVGRAALVEAHDAHRATVAGAPGEGTRQRPDNASAASWVQAVNPREIVRQRELGWPDFHPEDFCHQCGQRNPVWSAESEAWFAAYPEARDSDGGGICCPTCFAADYRRATGRERIVWMLSVFPGSADARPAPLTRPDTDELRATAHFVCDDIDNGRGDDASDLILAAADWIDAQPAPLTRPDLAEKWRGEADNQRVTHTLGAVAQAQTLRRCADELDAQPAPLTRPDTAAMRAEADDLDYIATVIDSGWVREIQRAAEGLRLTADWIDAQPAPLTPTPQPDGRWVEAIWHILVTEGGANAEDRDAFIAQWPDCVEYRFGGHLGSGGKVWAPGSKRSVPVVDFYPESSTVSRRAIAARINVHLCDAYVMAIALGSAAPPPTPVERPRPDGAPSTMGDLDQPCVGSE